MLFCITFLVTSVTTNASSIPSAVGLSKNFSQTFTITLYPSSSTSTGSNVSLSEGVHNFNVNLSTFYPNYSGTVTHGSTIDSIRLTTTSATNSNTGTVNETGSTTISGTIGSAGGYSYFDTDLDLEISPYSFNESDFNSYYPYLGVSASGLTTTVNSGSLHSTYMDFADGSESSSLKFFKKDTISHKYSSSWYYVPVFRYHTHLTYTSSTITSQPMTFTFTISFSMWGKEYTKDAVGENSSSFVVDTQGNNLQQQNNDISQDTNDVTHDTNNKVTSFFNSFFDNLIGVFVPESGFFSQWFSDLNTFMSQKLGFLWAPFDFIITFLNGVYSGSGSASITFPELAWIDGTVIIPETHFSFDNIGGESFTDLRDMIYFATDVILLGVVVMQFYQKLKLVFEGGSE